MWVDSNEDNIPREEELDVLLDSQYDSKIKAYNYLNDVTEDEVFENNKNKNYILNSAKIMYESKVLGKRIQKHYVIKTYAKYMDKLKRDKRDLNFERKLLKCFCNEEFKAENYEKYNDFYDY
jgi:hypothetical protein